MGERFGGINAIKTRKQLIFCCLVTFPSKTFLGKSVGRSIDRRDDMAFSCRLSHVCKKKYGKKEGDFPRNQLDKTEGRFPGFPTNQLRCIGSSYGLKLVTGKAPLVIYSLLFFAIFFLLNMAQSTTKCHVITTVDWPAYTFTRKLLGGKVTKQQKNQLFSCFCGQNLSPIKTWKIWPIKYAKCGSWF